ncbi:MAG: RHS repeat-associated core domain-containing protein, partial [Verrucomicrobiae bacterium]|nr:RHS repeat-associated core domain-containing protein [Verrucomicrobiae bacterium]
YMANWYDGVGRNVASANFGTCGGAVLIRPDVSPERSDTVLVSSTRYKDDGEANATIDPMGVETRWQNDHAGRRIRLIENYSPCGNEPDTNRITEYDYAPDGGLSRLTLINDVTGDQMTRWVYGTTTDDSEIARSDLLRAKIYPESDDTSSPLGDGTDGVYERIEYGYNRQGQVIYMKDPNETTHAYGYDDLGRQIEDQITAFGTGIDQGIATLGTTYDTKRLLRTKVTSYDGADAVANEVGFTYDDFGQLASDQQEHEGAVDGSTLEVQYAYEDGTRANTSRRTSMTYPDGRLLNYGFGTNDEANDLLSRVESLQIQGEAFELCSYTYVGAARYVKIAYAQPGVQLSYIKTSGSPLGDAGDPYNGYDRFGRTVDMRWVTTSGGAVRDRIQYGYDRANNRTWRRNLAATDGGQDNAYGYDGLYQVKQAALGTLNLNQTAIGSIPAEDELFDYDPTGNWTHYNRSADGNGVLDQSRISNQDNQLTQIDGSSNGIAYDKAGNATKLPPDVDGDWAEFYQLAWDGWNRLVEIKDSDAATVASYAYDGIFRRITKTLGVETRHYYYNDLWKCIEERVPTSSSSSSNPSSSLSSMSPGSSISSLGPGSSGSGFSSYIPGSSGSAFFAPAFASFVLTSPDQVEVQYVWGARPQHRDELVLRDRDSNGDGSLDERLYCLMDYFNPTSAIDTSGNVVERYRFSAYGLRSVMDGNWVERSQSNYDFKLAFQGQFRDEESGYYDYGFRYYAPSLGRWLTKDPIEEKGGQNIYGLTANNAVNAVDFLGLIGGVVPLGGGGWANPWTGEVHPVSPPGPPPWEEVEGDDGSTHAKVNKCNIVVFFGHNGLVPQGTIENDQCSAATVVACGGGINNTNPGVPQNPVPGAPRTPDDQGLNMGNEFAAFEASWQAAKEHAKTLCNEPPDCCSRIKVSVDCSGLHWYQHSSWTSIYGSVCETRPHYEYCRS